MRTNLFPPMLMLKDVPAAVTPLPGQTFLPEITQLVRDCQRELKIIMYQWKWCPHERDSLLQHLSNEVLMASRRGVKVRVLMNKEGPSSQLMAINGLTQRFLEQAGIEVKMGPSFPSTHAKLWIIDEDIVVVGSHNLSKKAVFNNDEASVIIKSRPVSMEFERYFDILWNRF